MTKQPRHKKIVTSLRLDPEILKIGKELANNKYSTFSQLITDLILKEKNDKNK